MNTTQPKSQSGPKRVTIGPVDSKHPGFDQDLQQYLLQQGFVSEPGGQEWRKDCENAIAADVAIQATFAQIGRLVSKHAPQLPNVTLL